MQIVIDIDKYLYNNICNYPNIYTTYLQKLIREGTPLPKGHGDLIDRKLALSDDGLCEFHMYDDYVKMRNYLKSIPTIIQADKDCRDCIEWESCECGKKGHENGTSKGYSIGECAYFIEADKESD